MFGIHIRTRWCSLVIDLFGIRILSLAAQFRTASNSNILAGDLAKISAVREYDGVSLLALSPEREEKFLNASMLYSSSTPPTCMRTDLESDLRRICALEPTVIHKPKTARPRSEAEADF